MSQVEIRKADERFRTRTDWLDSRHSFSFGPHYDPRNTHFGLLLVSNDDVVRPGAGFPPHDHQDMEIVTWVLSGALAHEDSAGNAGVIRPGLVQRMTAGAGIRHSEMNASDTEPVRFVQMWVVPDQTGLTPSYEQADVSARLDSDYLVPVASGRPEHRPAVRIHQRDATLYVARLPVGHDVTLPAAPFVHLYVAEGGVYLEASGPLDAGDAARITGSEGHRVTATEPAEILVWEMYSMLRSA